MSGALILVFLCLIFLLFSIYKEWLNPALSFFLVIIVFILGGILQAQEVLKSFANEQLASIILLLSISDILKKSTLINVVFNSLFAKAKSLKSFLARMILILAPASAFFNNTPLVAMMLPFAYNWSGKNKIAISKILIPLSYITILGGCMTLIGTSTNLIVNGLAVEAGYDSLGIFDFFPVGFSMLLIGGIFLLFFSKSLLPETQDEGNDINEKGREYFIEARVEDDSVLHQKTIYEAGLRNLENLFLFEIIRKNKSIRPVSPHEKLQSGDKLIFTGNTETINFFRQPIAGLSLPKKCQLPEADKLDLVEIVVSHNSSLAGIRIKDSNFRGKYDAAIIAVHRNGEKLSGKIGNIMFKPGDVILLLVGNDFYKRAKNIPVFYIISKQEEIVEPNIWKSWLLIGGLVLAITLSAFNFVSLFTALLILFAFVLALNIIPYHEIRKGFDFNLVILMALGLALGKGMINSGAAEAIAAGFLKFSGMLHVGILLFILFIVTNLLSSYITNKAAAAIIFPISMVIASSLGLPYQPFVLVVAFGAAANFITPIGYQTNLMVYGPGGYSFNDFFKIGLPLTLLYAVVCSAILLWQFNL